MKASFAVNYYNTMSGTPVWSHKYDETWEALPELYCPHCGKQSVWHDTGAGDYYVAENYLCASCGHGWHLPMGVHDQSNDEQGRQRLAILRTSVE